MHRTGLWVDVLGTLAGVGAWLALWWLTPMILLVPYRLLVWR